MNVIASFLSTLLVALPALPDPLTTPLTFPQMSSTTLPAVEGTAEVPASDVATSDTKLAATRHIHDNLYEIDIYSASMDRVITNNLLLPPGGPDNTTPRPTFYLMQGSYGGERGDTWATATDYESLFRGKNVNVVSPIGGDGTLFYDWKSTTTPVGTAKWMTYYTQELPFIMETQFHATDKRAIAGLSASGAPALNIAEAYPDKYVAVASLSGYTAVSSTMGRIMSLGVTAAKMAPVWGCLDGRMIRNGSTTIQSSTWTSSKIRRSTSIPAPAWKKTASAPSNAACSGTASWSTSYASPTILSSPRHVARASTSPMTARPMAFTIGRTTKTPLAKAGRRSLALRSGHKSPTFRPGFRIHGRAQR